MYQIKGEGLMIIVEKLTTLNNTKTYEQILKLRAYFTNVLPVSQI